MSYNLFKPGTVVSETFARHTVPKPASGSIDVSICAYIVPIPQAICSPFGLTWVRSAHAKRKSHSFFASWGTRCLGVPLEGILLWTK
jgi:hypothetical protein